jgi:competence ComEA-like helix-hairpin-helix protein
MKGSEMNVKRIVGLGLALALSFLASAGVVMAAGKQAPAGKVNINTATAEQLSELPGVGAKLAARIVEFRQKAGGFKAAQELMNVQGVGEKNFARLQAHLTVGDNAAKAGSSK